MPKFLSHNGTVNMFQFQDGSIKWLSIINNSQVDKKFQFQDGSIKWNIDSPVKITLR